MPEYDKAVIVAFGDDDYALLHRSNNYNVLTDKNVFCNYGYKEVLAWLPIPKFEKKKKMKKIKELNVSVTYEVTLLDVEVSDEVYKALRQKRLKGVIVQQRLFE